MELIVTVLVAVPIGYLIRPRLAAYLAYVAAHSFVFGFQNLEALLDEIIINELANIGLVFDDQDLLSGFHDFFQAKLTAVILSCDGCFCP